MTHTLTANEIQGRAIGAIFFSAFGTLWIALALYARESFRPLPLAWLAMILAVLLAMAIWLIRQAHRFPTVPNNPAHGRAFSLINTVQWIAVALTVFTLIRFHFELYIPSAITAIVGLHMFPLARLFHYRPHYVTGGLLCAWAAASALFLPLDHIQDLTSTGTGIVLLASAWSTLALAATTLRRAQRMSSVSC